ncbi:flap endonuclease-1 [Candidatus Pacearchaeota archaeon]|nr:flap endonuclease-1 [Candidatus Pacearchaeota archaeon]
MGLQIGDIISKKEIEFSDLKGKTLAVDAFNAIYQFLTTIRQADGTPLQDDNGNITSHLSGLFYRNMKLILEGVKLVYVFDGDAPKLKAKTHKKRSDAKQEMREKYEDAKEREDVDAMNKYSKFNVRLDDKKIQESKELLIAMGVAVVQAPGEGEAQASVLAKNGLVYAVASQDYDCLMFKSPKFIQNLSMARRRKTATGYREVHPQVITLKSVLEELELTQEQLICLGILSGTDYNPGGIKGLGPKKSLKIVKEYSSKEELFNAIETDAKFEKYELDFDWKAIYGEIENPRVDDIETIDFPQIDKEKIKEILVQYGFSADRIDSQLEKLDKIQRDKAQTTLF